MSVLREEILRDKAAKWLYENAKIEFVEASAAKAEKDGEEAPAEAEETAE